MAAPAIPTVTITDLDNGANAALSVPLTSVQLCIGCAITGGGSSAAAQVFAFSQPAAVQTALIGGPLMEKCGLLCENGGYALLAYRPTKADMDWLKNTEFVTRYDRLNIPKAAPGGGRVQRWTVGVDYFPIDTCQRRVAVRRHGRGA